jgi:hypothetical protein
VGSSNQAGTPKPAGRNPIRAAAAAARSA